MHLANLLQSRQWNALGLASAFSASMFFATPVYADGYNNPSEARAQCEKRGQADTPANLKKCCADLILVASSSEQKRLEAQCASSKPENTSKPAPKGV